MRVDFYQLSAGSSAEGVIAKLAQKMIDDDERLLIVAEDDALLARLDRMLWAGERRKDELKRITWELSHADFDFSMECGLSPANSFSEFQTDPDIKSESLRFGGANQAEIWLAFARRGMGADASSTNTSAAA